MQILKTNKNFQLNDNKKVKNNSKIDKNLKKNVLCDVFYLHIYYNYKLETP